MCLPAPALAVIGLAGSVVQGIGAAQASQANAASLDAQANMNERQAELEQQTGEFEAARTREVVNRALGAQRAGYAANGIALTGTAEEVIRETALEGALDMEAIRWNSSLRQDNLKYEAKINRMNAQTERSAAPLNFLAPVIGGVARFGGSFG